MVRVFRLGVVAILSAVAALSLARPASSPPPEEFDDGSVRSERSTNLSHITGTARKIQMYVKNRHLQILPDGTVNGTSDDGSDYTILQRSSVNNGQLKIQAVATCYFLCLDRCGLLYGSREFTEDCIFNEMIEQHHYNTYSSARYSNNNRTLYLALNKRGQSRKVQIRGRAQLGKLSTYTKVLTKTVPVERMEELALRILRARQVTGSSTPSSPHHPLRHHGYHQLCPPVAPSDGQQEDELGRDKFRCRRRKKRKKKKRRCKEGEEEGETCQKGPVAGNAKNKNRKKCEQDENEEDCQKRLQSSKRIKRPGGSVGGKKVKNSNTNNNNNNRNKSSIVRKKNKPKTLKNNRKSVANEGSEISKDLDSVSSGSLSARTGETVTEGEVLTEKRDNQRDLAVAEEHWDEKVTMTTMSTPSILYSINPSNEDSTTTLPPSTMVETTEFV